MKLTFLGTRGYIAASSRRHRLHAALLVGYRGRRVMMDCGETWLGRFERWSPDAIVLTHAHPDHAFGLAQGASCPVYATRATWAILPAFPVSEPRQVRPRVPFRIGEIRLEAFPLEHSLRAPAVGYRITAGRVAVFYAPDVAAIHDRARALAGVRVYIGDGATPWPRLIRRRGDRLIGHASIATQLTWCRTEGVPRAIVTHCGTPLVADEKRRGAEVRRLAAASGVAAVIAYDGMEILLRSPRRGSQSRNRPALGR